MNSSTKRLVLIDGKSVFYRGYYAMGALSLADGTPTGGVYGFAAIAMEIVKKLSPTKVVVAWDSKSSTSKRRAIYPEYKAGRVKPGEDFYAQIPLLRELILDLGWNFVEIDDYEADDIIGTLSLQADEAGDWDTYIISSDLDMLQIVDSNTHMWRILKNTVSPSYAEEIKTSYYSEGLDGILNARGAEVSGIINGIDTKVFNPHSDPLIPANYDRAHMKGKAACKEELQRRMGLEVNPDIPIIAMVTRMTEQKGFDLVASQLDRLVSGRDVEFMLLGSGDARFEDFMRGAEARYKGRVCAYIGYNEELAHLVYAGSDFYLMPSRFEPCGLSQMIAMRYGTIPIVRETGGLKDTVEPYNCFTGGGNGFSFANYNADEMYDTILYALGCCSDKKVMRYLISHAMEADFSFDLSAEAYARLYVCML